MKKLSIIIPLFLFLLLPNSSFAQQQVYSYDAINTTITVNGDATFTVEEQQLFNYEAGTFHQGWRAISLDKISRITDVQVIDGATGQPLQHSSQRLNKTDPDSWGKYTGYTQDGNVNIEWYYDLANTKHLWVLRYVVHGGFSFYKENDRLYWNALTDYSSPIGLASVKVLFPENADLSSMQFDAYREDSYAINKIVQGNNSIYFETPFIQPYEAFTIDIAFPKGIISESAFWKEWLTAYWGYVGSGIAAVLGVLFSLLYWYRTERYGKGRGVIIAQYEPPQQLRPAMAEVLVKEKITEKTWPATIIDLAVRGYIAIKEEPEDKLVVFIRLSLAVILVGILGAISVLVLFVDVPFEGRMPLVLFIAAPILVLIIAYRKEGSIKKSFAPKSYILEKVKEYENDPSLEEYEVKFLRIIFSGIDLVTKEKKNHFSLKEIKKSSSSQRELARLLNLLKDDLYKETDKDTKAFEKAIHKEKYFMFVLFGLTFFFAMLNKIQIIDLENQLHFLVFVCAIVVAVVIAFIKFESRLSHEGYLLKEDWLGFKLYLETAEKYRMQNLTPDIFEKYLPYAMIFGIEKKWAKSFEGIHMQPPSWYGSSSVGMAAGISSGTSFSPVGFSSSFSSSFSSAFASAGGGGGGGGSAGGGGGGG
ncbi:MAG: membrane-like protein, partial [uncultured bacterium]